MMTAVDDPRLTDLEVRYTFLQQTVEDMSRVLHEQQRCIDGMSSRLQRLETLVAESVEQPQERLPQEKPPHY